MRKLLLGLAVAVAPVAGLIATAPAASAYECDYSVSDEIHVDCNAVCDRSSAAINGLSRKLTGNDAVYCLE